MTRFARSLFALPLLSTVAFLSGCTGEMPASVIPGERITVEGDTFVVNVTGNRATLRNYSSGLHNQSRLLETAGRATTLATGCPLKTIEQQIGANTYIATLDCP